MRHRAAGAAVEEFKLPTTPKVMAVKDSIRGLLPEEQEELLIWLSNTLSGFTVNGSDTQPGKHRTSKSKNDYIWNTNIVAGMTDEQLLQVEESLGFR